MKSQTQVRDSFKKRLSSCLQELQRLHGKDYVKYAVTAAAFDLIRRMAGYDGATDAELYWVVKEFGKGN